MSSAPALIWPSRSPCVDPARKASPCGEQDIPPTESPKVVPNCLTHSIKPVESRRARNPSAWPFEVFPPIDPDVPPPTRTSPDTVKQIELPESLRVPPNC